MWRSEAGQGPCICLTVGGESEAIERTLDLVVEISGKFSDGRMWDVIYLSDT